MKTQTARSQDPDSLTFFYQLVKNSLAIAYKKKKKKEKEKGWSELTKLEKGKEKILIVSWAKA